MKLSIIVIGLGQLCYGQIVKGLFYLACFVILLTYFVTRGFGDLIGFFTLGTNEENLWLGIPGDNSLTMLILGLFAMLTQFAWPWSDVLLPKLLLKDRNMWTVAVGLFNLPETHFARFAAGSVFIAIPIVILYFCLVKNIVNGLTAGSVKG